MSESVFDTPPAELPVFEEEGAAAAERARAANENDVESNAMIKEPSEVIGRTGELIESGVNTMTMGGMAAGLSEHEAEHLAQGERGIGALGSGVLNAVGGVANAFGIANGLHEMDDPNTQTKGALDVASSGLGLGSNIMSGLGAVSKAAAPLAKVMGPMLGLGSGLFGTAANVEGLADKGLNVDDAIGLGTNLSSVVSGGAAALSAGAAGTAEAVTLGSVATGASGVGLALAGGGLVGKGIHALTEEHSKGNFGVDEHGHERTADDEAEDSGAAFEWALNDAGMNSSVAHAGGAAWAMGKGVINTLENPILSLYHYMAD